MWYSCRSYVSWYLCQFNSDQISNTLLKWFSEGTSATLEGCCVTKRVSNISFEACQWCDVCLLKKHLQLDSTGWYNGTCSQEQRWEAVDREGRGVRPWFSLSVLSGSVVCVATAVCWHMISRHGAQHSMALYEQLRREWLSKSRFGHMTTCQSVYFLHPCYIQTVYYILSRS